MSEISDQDQIKKEILSVGKKDKLMLSTQKDLNIEFM